MSTATDEAAAAPVAETGPRRFRSVEDMVLFHNPHWEYLNNATLPVRPPNDEEAAELASRREDGAWIDLYHPAEPHIILPPSPEVAALTETAAAPDEATPAPEPEPAEDPEPVVLDPRLESALAAYNLAHDEQDATEARDIPAEPETTTHTAVMPACGN